MNPISEMTVTYLTNALWMTCIIAAVSNWCLLSRALRRGPSSHRHALWVAALLLLLCCFPCASLRGSRNNDKLSSESVAAASAVEPGETDFSGDSSWALWRRMRHGGHPVQFGPLGIGFCRTALLRLHFLSSSSPLSRMPVTPGQCYAQVERAADTAGDAKGGRAMSLSCWA